MKWSEIGEKRCSVARTLSVIGDRWTLLILRDCFLGHRRFEQFQERLGVTRHILANRLNKLVANGILKREPYEERPPRYEYRLTAKGRDLYPVLLALMSWGDKHMAGADGPPLELYDRNTGERVEPKLVINGTGDPVRWGQIVAKKRFPEVDPLRREYVDSAAINWFRYDEDTSTLDLQFANGAVYRYWDVTPEVVAALRNAESKGEFVNTAVKQGRRYARVS